MMQKHSISSGPALFANINTSPGTEVHNQFEISTCGPLKCIMDNPILIVFICMGKSIRIQS